MYLRSLVVVINMFLGITNILKKKFSKCISFIVEIFIYSFKFSFIYLSGLVKGYKYFGGLQIFCKKLIYLEGRSDFFFFFFFFFFFV